MQNLRIGWFGQLQFDYSTDRTGRLAAVVGATSFNGITTYANSPSYDGARAAQGRKLRERRSDDDFNIQQQASPLTSRSGRARLRSSKRSLSITATEPSNSRTTESIRKFDRLYRYDFVGRTTQAKSGAPARGDTDNAINIPYTMNYTHDAFGHITQFSGLLQHAAHVELFLRQHEPQSVLELRRRGEHYHRRRGELQRSTRPDVWSGRRSSIPTVGFRWRRRGIGSTATGGWQSA
ncbi:MAG: hypothetical protein IPJ30_23090 [Acidobacteria bacterium]|nr:hypothetical protein [Acidobacteriota bacterium]